MRSKKALVCFLIVFCALTQATPQRPDELSAYNEPPSRLRGVIEKYREDYGSINRFYTAQMSANRFARIRQLYSEHQRLLDRLNFDALNADEQIDVVLFRNY